MKARAALLALLLCAGCGPSAPQWIPPDPLVEQWSPPNHVCPPTSAQEDDAWRLYAAALSADVNNGHLYLAHQEYTKAMLPACTLWQRITLQALSRDERAARIYCLQYRYPAPDALGACVLIVLHGGQR